jgi:signal transduction histidine kinase
MMYQEVEVLKRLVEDLRTLSLADTGKLALHIEPVVMADLLAQVQTAYAHQARQQDVIIEVETAVTQPPIALDQARMRQVLNNLVSNALRYTPAGGKIKLSTSTKDNHFHVTISDNGYGIPEADLPYIFNRFYRGDPSRQEGYGESGLGLAIVKSLVEAMGGKISVKSAGVNQGASFVITFLTKP